MSETSPYPDEGILAAVRCNGMDGWALFCAKYDPVIQAIARWPKWNFSEHEQQDVCQNIHMHLQTALPKFKQQSSLSWFIKQIAMRQCINEIRRQKRWRTFFTPSIQKTTNGRWNEMEFSNPDALDPHDETIQQERVQNLRSTLEHLQETCQEIINLFYLKHLSYREISGQLGISKNTVGSRLAKCLDKLHEKLRRNPVFERINT